MTMKKKSLNWNIVISKRKKKEDQTQTKKKKNEIDKFLILNKLLISKGNIKKKKENKNTNNRGE